MGNCITLDTRTSSISIRSPFVLTPTKSEADTDVSQSSCRSVPSLHLHQLMTKEIKKRNVYEDYEIIKDLIGEGSMGSVSVVQKKRHNKKEDCFLRNGFFASLIQKNRPSYLHKMSSMSSTDTDFEVHLFALKTIKVNVCKDPSYIRELRNEIAILQSLDHPNIVRAIATYEYFNNIAIVMEMCTGGDLYSRDPYTEDRARHIVRQITSAVAYMHRCGIMHRDLKYENIMFVSFRSDADINIIDYGLSKKFEYDGQHIDEGVGTIYSMAPEVMDGDYDTQADLWSIGVITYMLLSSSMPFGGGDRARIIKRIHLCEYSFNNPRWTDLSTQSWKFVSSLIKKDPASRLTAEQALQHPWLDADFKKQQAMIDNKSMRFITKSLERYANYSKLKKLILHVVAHESTCSEIGKLREVFEKFDLLRNSSVSFEEFKEVLMKCGCDYNNEQLLRLFSSIDLDGSGEIDYTEFIAATIEARGAIENERLLEAFKFFDGDDKGYITKDCLRQLMQYGLLGRNFTDEYVDEVFDECDLNHDGIISFDEFLSLWGR